MGLFGIDHDDRAMCQMFESAAKNDCLWLASGYFNLTHNYMDTMVKKSLADYKILMCSLEVSNNC